MRLPLSAVLLAISCSSAPHDPSVDGTDAGQQFSGDAAQRPDASLPPPLGDDAGVCAATFVEAERVVVPTDIVWIVDNSGSMAVEEERVQDNLNAFAAEIGVSGIDYRVVLITDRTHVDVPPPLSNSTRFRGVHRFVSSHDALEVMVSSYGLWGDFTRSGAVPQLIVVTDDDSDWTPITFLSQLTQRDPEMAANFILHAVVAESGPQNSGPCYLLSRARGQTYLDLQAGTGGVFQSLCQQDWTPVFDALAASVVQGAALPCSFELPAPPAGEELDLDEVNVLFSPAGGAPEYLGRVPSAGACGSSRGWHYDDPAAPTSVELCPAACAAAQAATSASIEVAFGCESIIIIID